MALVFSISYVLSHRFITILYYLNDVEEGGETAFLLADNSTVTPQVGVFNF